MQSPPPRRVVPPPPAAVVAAPPAAVVARTAGRGRRELLVAVAATGGEDQRQAHGGDCCIPSSSHRPSPPISWTPADVRDLRTVRDYNAHRRLSDSDPANVAGRGLWFNPAVRDRPASVARRRAAGAGGDWPVLRWPLVALGGRPAAGVRARRRRRRAAPRTSSTTPRRPASTTATTASSSTSSGGGVAAFDCDGDGRDELFLAGGTEPAALYHNDSPIGGALRFSRAPVARHRPDRGRPAPTRSTSTATARSTSSCSAAAATSCCAASATAASRRPTGQLGIDVPPGLDDRVQRHVGGHERAADAGLRPLPRARGGPLRRELARAARAATGRRATPPRSRSPRATARCRCCSATGATRGSATCGCRTTATTTSTARSSCGGSRPASRPAPYTEADGWQPLQIWGMGIASQDLTGDGRPEVFLTSQADNKLQTLAAGAARPDYRGHRAAAAGSPRSGPTSAATCCRRRPGTRSSPTSTTTASSDLLVTKGNVDAQLDQATPRSEQPVHRTAGRHVRRSGASRPGSSTTSGPAARRSSTSTSTACSTWSSSTGGPNVTLWRNVGRGDASQAEADGPLDRRAAAAAGAERRRHRRVARRADRRHARPRGR